MLLRGSMLGRGRQGGARQRRRLRGWNAPAVLAALPRTTTTEQKPFRTTVKLIAMCLKPSLSSLPQIFEENPTNRKSYGIFLTLW